MTRFVLVIAGVAQGACTLDKISGNSAGGSSGAIATGASQTSGGGTTTRGSTSTGGSSSGGTSSGGASSSGSSTGAPPSVCHPACGSNQTCEDAGCNCLAGTTDCPLEDGGLNCVDEQTDDANCNGCENSCPDSATCRGGACDCDAGPACFIPNHGLMCFAFGSDPANCGFCFNGCGVTQSCIDGMCECAEGLTACGPFCYNTDTDPSNCGTCGKACDPGFAQSSGCRKGMCVCGGVGHNCAKIPAGSPPMCECTGLICTAPSFATDIYPLLSEQTGDFGCAASGCHSGAGPAGGLGFLDSDGNLDAGMAYAELLGVDGGGSSAGIPACDAGLALGAASTECACASRVVPGDAGDSYLVDVLSDHLPANCATDLPMPLDADGGWAPLNGCEQQLIIQWIATGAGP